MRSYRRFGKSDNVSADVIADNLSRVVETLGQVE